MLQRSSLLYNYNSTQPVKKDISEQPPITDVESDATRTLSVDSGSLSPFREMLAAGSIDLQPSPRGEEEHDQQRPPYTLIKARTKISLLFEAVANNELEQAFLLIQDQPDLLITRDALDRIFLEYAAKSRNEELMNHLISSYPELCQHEHNGENILHWVARVAYPIHQDKKTSIMSRLIELTPAEYLNKQDFQGATPLHIACMFGNAAHAVPLLKSGAKMDMRNYLGANILHVAAATGSFDVVQEIIRYAMIHYGEHVSRYINTFHGENEYTALHDAAASGSVDIVNFLIKNKAVINSCGKNGETPLYCAVKNNHNAVTYLLLQKGANPNLAPDDIQSLLYVAVKNGNTDCVKYLLKETLTPIPFMRIQQALSKALRLKDKYKGYSYDTKPHVEPMFFYDQTPLHQEIEQSKKEHREHKKNYEHIVKFLDRALSSSSSFTLTSRY
ncbi:ankyrin repeat domain-containing protein [bacterium]|nr:ankyrin repeat domain-containing protein [bacterium]NBX71794.1 ankyrin repeat domain-containing protein [bacterium]